MRLSAPGRAKDPFTAALDALRDQLRSGRLVHGQPLTITDLAHDLGLSATPVREALSRLAGQGLIEDRRGRGYFAPRYEVSDLTELYGLRRLYIAEALAAHATAPPKRPDLGDLPAADPAAAIGHVLDWVVAGSGNRVLFEAYRQVVDRLAPATRVEGQVLALDREAAALVRGLADPPALGVALAQLHEARQAQVADLVRAMRASANIAAL